jgi:SAM-dependent methyltransferase
MKNAFVRYLMRQSFQPDFISIFINPFYFIRRGLFKGIVKNRDYLYGVMLDFGCGRKPYQNLIQVDKYVGVDIEVSGHSHKNSMVDVFYDGRSIPFEANSFDSFLCSEVFEHLFNLSEILNELRRILKHGGKGVITVPFVWPEHEVPYDFGRYSSFGMESILQSHGFRIISMEKSGHFVECLFQFICLLYSQVVYIKVCSSKRIF